MRKILLLMLVMLLSSSFVYAGTPNGIDSEGVVYQGNKIHVDLTDITSHYDASINVTYPNGSDKIFIPLGSIVGYRVYIFNNTQQIGSYRFHSYDTALGQWQTDTFVDILSDTVLRSSINFVPSGMTFGVINKTFRHDWIISNPFDAVTLSSASCKIYNTTNLAFIKNADSSIIYDNKLISAVTNLTSASFTAGKSYMSNCTVLVTYGTSSIIMNHMSQYIYVTKESQIKNELDSIYLVARQQYNKTISMFSNLNATYLNTRILLNRTIRLNTTLNQLNLTTNQILQNTTKILNVTRTNQNLLNLIWSKVQSIWNGVFRINSTINKLNQTIVSNNTFIIAQLRNDHIAAIS